MPKFIATVFETVTGEVQYEIEADTQEEAEEKAAIGDTMSETKIKDIGVTDRNVESVSAA